MIAKLIADARKIIFKFGSNTLAGNDGKINTAFLGEFAEQAAALMKKAGKQILLTRDDFDDSIRTLNIWLQSHSLAAVFSPLPYKGSISPLLSLESMIFVAGSYS